MRKASKNQITLGSLRRGNKQAITHLPFRSHSPKEKEKSKPKASSSDCSLARSKARQKQPRILHANCKLFLSKGSVGLGVAFLVVFICLWGSGFLLGWLVLIPAYSNLNPLQSETKYWNSTH